MFLTANDWRLVLVDPHTNYIAEDYAAATQQHDGGELVPVLVLDAIHVETGKNQRLTIRMQPIMVRLIASSLTRMAEALPR